MSGVKWSVRRQVGCQASSGVSGVKWGIHGCKRTCRPSASLFVRIPQNVGDDINHRPPDSPNFKLCNTNIMPPTSPAYGWCSAIIFNKPSSRDATAVCGTVCKPPRQAYVILVDVDHGGSDLIVDRPKAPTKTNYIHHAPFSLSLIHISEPTRPY